MSLSSHKFLTYLLEPTREFLTNFLNFLQIKQNYKYSQNVLHVQLKY